MSVGLIGRGIVAAGIVIGLLAISLTFASSGDASVRYLDDGTVAAFLLIALTIASILPPEIGKDRLGAASGSAAFGFFLFGPASFGFDHFGYLGAGAWLGVCTALIPIGALVVFNADRPAAAATSSSGATPHPLTIFGLLLILVGIWLPTGSGDGAPSFWNLSFSGHALGLLMLLLVLVNLVLVGAARSGKSAAADRALLAAAITFGLVEAEWIGAAFNNFGLLGSGAWIVAAGGLLLMLGAAAMRRAAPVGHGAEPGATGSAA
jgi:hypothetical protein